MSETSGYQGDEVALAHDLVRSRNQKRVLVLGAMVASFFGFVYFMLFAFTN